MDWMTIIAQLFEIVIFPLLAIGTIYLINLIQKIQSVHALRSYIHDKCRSRFHFSLYIPNNFCIAVFADNDLMDQNHTPHNCLKYAFVIAL